MAIAPLLSSVDAGLTEYMNAPVSAFMAHISFLIPLLAIASLALLAVPLFTDKPAQAFRPATKALLALFIAAQVALANAEVAAHIVRLPDLFLMMLGTPLSLVFILLFF